VIDDKRLTEVICESSDVFERKTMAKDRTATPEIKQQRPPVEEKPGSCRRNPLGFKDRSAVERPAGEIPQPQHVLETVDALGRTRRLAQYLEGLLE
jgi:hypothetical protein